MRPRIRSNTKTLDIRLFDEKFYFPGETIKGAVIVHPKSPTKTNHIRLTFAGEVFLNIKEKESISLFEKTELIQVSDAPGKTHVLEPKEHTFLFEFQVPDGLDLPSSMEFGKKKAHIRYSLTAIHDRPMVPETLSAKAEYSVPILEFVDITASQFTRSREQAGNFTLGKGSKTHQCQVKATIPRFGFTRGDIIPLSIFIRHYTALTRNKAVKVDLLRCVDFASTKNVFGKEDVLKSMEHDVDITEAANYTQLLRTQFLIPTSTPPSIQYRGKIVKVQYKLRVHVYVNEKKSNVESQSVDLPITIGTWPRAAVPIDDEDESEQMLIMDDDTDSEPRPSLSSQRPSYESHRRNRSSASLSTITMTMRNTHLTDSSSISPSNNSNNNNGVIRSDSNVSRTSDRSRHSVASWRSSQSFDQPPPTLSRNLSSTTNHSATDLQQPQQPQHQRQLSNGSAVNLAIGASFLNRSSSTPDLLIHPPGVSGPTSGTDPYASDRMMQAAYDYRNPQQRHSKTLPTYAYNNQHHQPQQPQPQAQPQYHPQQPYQYHLQQQQQQQQQFATTSTPPPIPENVPTHILQPMASTSASTATSSYSSAYRNNQSPPAPPSAPSSSTYPVQQQQQRSPHRNYNYSYYDDGLSDTEQPQDNGLSDSDDSDDDGDLLRIIEKKKKQAEREMRRKQRMMFTVAE
ncbi:hypothetical protein BCR43DRAFT_490211 [Syncephalastrum racemosum]|uniref:Arrestin C-terminal-like domain-containing protein n=1 Tax=Syncephalastrum racemosum TaxID=13706 RepID=A0A1X2HFK8_SYNRA|nr:hypothetical protein BCR43DRAFT_490211 [Syncephalastrum racemosum]